MKKCLSATLRGTTAPVAAIEGLESRLLMAADGPRVLTAVADNRGQVTFTFDRPLDQATLSTSDIIILTAGKDGKLGTKDDAALPIAGSIFNTGTGTNTGLNVSAAVPANTPYRVVLLSGGIRGTNHKPLDGESVGSGAIPTGNGVAGGNVDIVVTPTKKLTARMSTSNGNIDIRLYNTQTPITVTNFLKYANGAQWDTTFFHRLVAGFVLQGGGFRVTKHNATDLVANFGAIKNEPGISNTVGTIAMAKLGGQPNSASNQFFFNLGNNATNLDGQNGGFTVFGSVVDSTSLQVMQSLGQAGTEGVTNPNTGVVSNPVSIAGQQFGEVPMINVTTYESRNRVLNPAADLVRIFRVALLQAISPTPGTTVIKAAVHAVTPASVPALVTAPSIGTAVKPGLFSSSSIIADDSSVLA